MKKFMMMVCSAALLLSLVGCGKTDSQKDRSDDAKEKKPATTQSETLTDNRPESDIPVQPEGESDSVVEIEPEEEWEPAFESDRLRVYDDRFHEDEIKALHTAMFGDLYVELEDGLYVTSNESDEEKINLVDDSVMTDWSYSHFTDFMYVDNNGYYHINYRGTEYLAHGIKGEIFYCYTSSDLVVYSIDEDGSVYCSKFDATGKKLQDNTLIRFEIDDVLYDRVDSLQVLPAKGDYISAPYILIYIDGIGYVQNFYFVFRNEFSVSTGVFLTEKETYLDHSNSNVSFDYVSEGVEDKILYIYNDGEYAIHLPDGHTVDEIKYFNRGYDTGKYYNDNMSCYDMLVFDNGDVYFWDDDPSILGENPVKDEELSQIGAEIQEIIFANTEGYYILMSDGVIYEVCK